ncbi:uncharacterized protein [Mobula birostris]|uniref:uncharacterized protein n=1 Tax=Mobula birostris TaxID=1983395 RepID=UPI003B27C83B
MCQFAITVQAEEKERPDRAVDSLGASDDALPLVYCDMTALKATQLPGFSPGEVATVQRDDPDIGWVWHAVEEGDVTRAEKAKHGPVSPLLKEWLRLRLKNRMLYQVTSPPDRPRCWQLVLPEKYRKVVLKSLHDDSGHLRMEKTYGLLKDRFYWPRMRTEVEEYCKSCIRCIRRKTLPGQAAPLSYLQSAGPLDLVCMDFLSREPDASNTANVLVITDHYTRYAQAFPTRDQRATTVAKVLWEKYFVYYGLPRRIHSDQGRDFESKLIYEQLLGMLGVEKSRTTPYHPQGDPQPERFNQTLPDMLGTLEISKKNRWSRHIGHLVHCYNCTHNEATGYSPYHLMFVHKARLPIDPSFGTDAGEVLPKPYLKYVSDMRQELKRAYELDGEAVAWQNQGNNRRYDQKVKFSQLLPGDRVLIRNLGLLGKHKQADPWAATPYVVENQMPNLPVFRVRPEDGKGPVKILHRNHLLPLGQDVQVEQEPEEMAAPSTRVEDVPIPGEMGPGPAPVRDTDSEDDDWDGWYILLFADAPGMEEETPGLSPTGLEGASEGQSMAQRGAGGEDAGPGPEIEGSEVQSGLGDCSREGLPRSFKGSPVVSEAEGVDDGVRSPQRSRKLPERLAYVAPGEQGVISTVLGSQITAFCTSIGLCVLREGIANYLSVMRA